MSVIVKLLIICCDSIDIVLILILLVSNNSSSSLYQVILGKGDPSVLHINTIVCPADAFNRVKFAPGNEGTTIYQNNKDVNNKLTKGQT